MLVKYQSIYIIINLCQTLAALGRVDRSFLEEHGSETSTYHGSSFTFSEDTHKKIFDDDKQFSLNSVAPVIFGEYRHIYSPGAKAITLHRSPPNVLFLIIILLDLVFEDLNDATWHPWGNEIFKMAANMAAVVKKAAYCHCYRVLKLTFEDTMYAICKEYNIINVPCLQQETRQDPRWPPFKRKM